MRESVISLLLILVLGVAGVGVFAGESVHQVDLILDASGSMWGQINGIHKIEMARKAVKQLVQNLSEKPNVRLALRVYGHQNMDCTNSVLEIPMGPIDADAVSKRVDLINPKGKTPITYSLQEAVKDFDAELDGEKTIIMVTDGLESCNGDPCRAAEALKKAGIVTQLHIVGFGMDRSGLNMLECIAKPFGGLVLGAGNSLELDKAFEKITHTIVPYTLEITAKDEGEKSVLVDYEIFSAGNHELMVASGDNSLGNKALIALKPGAYDLKVVSQDSGDSVWLNNISIKEDVLLKKEVLFAQRDLEVRISDGAGNYLYGDVVVLDSHGLEIKTADTSMGSKAVFVLMPGIYDIKAIDYETKREAWLRGVDLIKEKAVNIEITVR